ncbi:nuclear transport factor 2 family protein [bacterium]|nr:nuclear transport factor 2 family protein [bacterium]
MRRFVLTSLLLLAAAAPLRAAPAPAPEPVTAEAVEAALHEYVLARYAGDEAAVRARVHPRLARRMLQDRYWGQESRQWLREFTPDQLRFTATPHNRARLDDPAAGRAGITVFDLEARTASAVMVMEDAVDYVHVIHFDGRWLVADSALLPLAEVGAAPPAPTHDDDEAVARVVRDYGIGFYEKDGAKVQGTCHSQLSKRTVESHESVDFNWLGSISWDEIAILGERFNAHWGFDPARARCEVEVYRVTDGIAAAKLTGSVWFDYLHLMRVNGEWRIVNIMYEGLPEERQEKA